MSAFSISRSAYIKKTEHSLIMVSNWFDGLSNFDNKSAEVFGEEKFLQFDCLSEVLNVSGGQARISAWSAKGRSGRIPACSSAEIESEKLNYNGERIQQNQLSGCQLQRIHLADHPLSYVAAQLSVCVALRLPTALFP